MSQIFISYANEDTDFARRLAAAFEEHGWSVWWDKQIPPGMDYARVIEAAVEAASCVVVLWSEHSIRSRWVQTEAAVGADRDIVATVIVDDTPGEDIPFEFRRLQAVNLKDWKAGVEHAGFEALANRVGSILEEPPRVASPKKPAVPLASWRETLTSWGSGRQRLFRIGGAFSAVLALISCSEAIDGEDVRIYAAVVVLLVLAVVLMSMGRKAA